MKSKMLHVASFVIGLLLAITIFAFIYINPSSESVLLDSTWSIVLAIIFILNLILSGYFIFRNSVRTTLSGTGSSLLLISYLSFVALIIYVFNSISGALVGLMIAYIMAPILGVVILVLYFIGVAMLVIVFLRRSKSKLVSGM